MAAALITPAELVAAPTGIDWTSIQESTGSGDPAQAVEQLNVIDRATAWVTNVCMQRLDATADTEQVRVGGASTRAWVDRDGMLVFRTLRFPVLEVMTFQWSYLTPVLNWQTSTAANIVILGDDFRLNRLLDASRDYGFLSPGLVSVTYVNGWPNTYLTAAATAGSAVTLQVEATFGMTATPLEIGNMLTLYDGGLLGGLQETVQVTDIVDATHVTVASLANDHAGGVGVSAIPADVKWATILACLHFARQRGDEIVGIDNRTGAPSPDTTLKEATSMLQPYMALP